MVLVDVHKQNLDRFENTETLLNSNGTPKSIENNGPEYDPTPNEYAQTESNLVESLATEGNNSTLKSKDKYYEIKHMKTHKRHDSTEAIFAKTLKESIHYLRMIRKRLWMSLNLLKWKNLQN